MIRFHKTMEPLFFAAERNTMKVTPEILKALNRAKDYYGNTTQLAKHLGIAHSTFYSGSAGRQKISADSSGAGF
ncbi:MAG: helix-turn-helix domain-containing protein [Victivallales bacterium]